MKRSKRKPRAALIFLTCMLAVPTVACILYGTPENAGPETFSPLLAVGALLGIAHLVLRPLLRLITAPLGCMTLGLSGTAIDIALIYLCARFVEGFYVPGFFYALVTAIFINSVCALLGVRR